MKKLVLSAVALLSVAFAGQAQFFNQLFDLGIFNHVGVGVHAATTGFGFEVSTPITEWCQMRVGGTFMPGFDFNTTQTATFYDRFDNSHESDVDLNASLKRAQGSLIFNGYPLGRRAALFVAVGAYFGGADIVKVKGHCTDAEVNDYLMKESYIEIGDYQLPFDKEGWARGALRANKFRPYLGIGWGRPVPNKRINFMVELGVQFMGRMKIYDTDNKVVDLKKITGDDDDWQKWMNKLTVYPVLKFTINGRII